MQKQTLSELEEERDQLALKKAYWRKKVGNRYVPMMIAVGLAMTIINLLVGIALLLGIIVFTRAIDEHIKQMQDEYIEIVKEIRELEDKAESFTEHLES